MICIETRHFGLNRILLLAIGLWPYWQSKFARLQVISFYGILTSFIVFQLTALVTTKCTPHHVIKVLSSALFFFTYVIKYNSFLVNIQTVKYLLEQIQEICNGIKDKNEIAIIKKYGCNTKRYTARITLFSMCSVFTVIFMPIWRHMLGVFLLMNESQSRRTLHIVSEYFVDQEKYFYLILLHTSVAFCIGVIAALATGTMLVGYLKHACGMFKIASYRIEQAMAVNIQQNISLQHEMMIYREMIYAVDIHRKAMKLSEILISNFEGSFFFLIAVAVSCLSLNLFRVVSLGENIEELMLHLVCVVVILLYMFLANYAGQEITDHNNHVFFTAYNVRWYVAPLHIQKLILFLLQRGSKTFSLNIGGLFVASLECFASLTSTSISFFTVMYSTQRSII